MIGQLDGIRSFFKASKIPSAILCYDKGNETIVYINEAFQEFFPTARDGCHKLNLADQYLGIDLPQSFVDGKLDKVLKKIIDEKGSEEFTIDYIKNGARAEEVLILGFTFLLEQDGKKYISHTCHPKTSDIKRIEKEQALFKHAEDVSNFGFWELDLRNSVVFWSKGVYRIVEIEPGSIELTQDSGMEMVHPEDRERALQMIQDALDKGHPYKIKKRFLLPNGKVKHILSSGSVIFDEINQPQKLIGVFQDITDKIEEEKQLHEYSVNLQMLVNSIDGIIWEADPETFSFTYISPQSYKILGFTPEEWLDSPGFWEDHIHPEDVQMAVSLCQIETAACRDHVFEYRMLSKWGKYIWLQDRVTVISENDKPQKIKGVMFDVTAEKEMIDAIQNRERTLKNIFDGSLDVICTIDENGVFTQVSAASANIWGFTPQELVGKPYIELVSPEDTDITLDVARRIFEGEHITNFQNHYIHKKGNLVTINWSVKWDEAERLMYCVAKDVTVLEESFKKLKKSEARFRGIYESSTYFVIRTDLEGNYTYFNKKFQDQFSWLYPGDTLINKSIWSSVLEKDVPKVRETGNLVIMNPGKVFQVELDKPKEGGGVISTLWDFMAITDENGMPLEVQCMGIDITERVKFEKELQLGNERFGLVMQAGSEGIWDYNPGTGDMFLGDGFRRNFGLEIHSLDQNNAYINKQFHPDDKDWNLKFFHDTLADPSKDHWLSKFRLKNGDGKYIHIEDRAVILRNKKGEAIRVVGAMKDVSHENFYHQLEMMERDVMAYGMQVDVALNDVINLQLKKLEGIFPGMKTSVMKVKENKIMKMTSPSMPEGYLDAINGSPIGERAGSCGTAAYLRKKVVVSDVSIDPLWEVYRDLGKKYGFQACWSQPIFNSEGNVVATFANYYETVKSPDDMEVQAMDRAQRLLSLILEKFEFIEQIKSSNERFENVTEATNDAIWDFDSDKNKLYWAKGFETLFKFDLSTFTPTFEFLISRIHEEDRPRVVGKIQAFMADPKSLNWFEEYRFKRGDDRYAYVIDRAKFMRNKEGKVFRVIGAMTDITHLKEYESSLESLNKTLNERAKELAISNAELEQFAYVASHDLQEPLRMVTSFLHQLERRYADIIDEKGKKYIHFAVDGAVRMRNIILDLLEFSRVGKSPEDITEFSLNEIVNEILLLQRKSLEEKNAKVSVSSLPTIRYHKSPIFQVFKNLIENALKYCAPDKIPEVNISCEEKETEWIISVADNGIGIEKEHYDEIFIIFQRLHNKEKYAGTGMGLAIVKKIIDGFEGNIWVDSVVDKGSVFSFTIPKKHQAQE